MAFGRSHDARARASRRLRIAGHVLGALVTCTLSGQIRAQTSTFDIAAQPLPAALRAFARQSHMEILYESKEVSGKNGSEVRGELDNRLALTRLLQDTGLRAIFSSETSATVRPLNSHPQGKAEEPVGTPARPAKDPGERLEEVVVTAQKRSERLEDVPVPVTALDGAQLADANRSRLKDYYAQVPGFSISMDTLGPMVAIRGISPAGFGNPTVGFMIDDVPVGASTSYGGGFLAPEVDPGDTDHLEILRGPQGTLYGASSMGGLVKYVTVSPTIDKLSGRAQTGLSGVQNGGDVGYNISAAVNLPVNDSIAVLASGFRHLDPGYIENIRSHEKNLNEYQVTGGHLSALWKPSPRFSLKLSAMLQRATQTGSAFAAKAAGFEDLQQDFLPNSDELTKTFQDYSATINANLGAINLVSVTGYGKTHLDSAGDITATTGDQTALSFPTYNTVEHMRVDGRKLSSELRLTIPLGERIEWLVGGFYTHERTPTVDDWVATDDSAQFLGLFARFLVDTTYTEGAGFTDLTYRITDRFDLQVGGRYSKIHQTFRSTDIGPYVTVKEGETSPLVYPSIAGNGHASTYLFTPRFKITPELMLYARFASGYRAGGVNPPTLVHVDGIPSQFAPDKTLNYEVGIKGAVLDRALQFDASAYHIDWKDIQIGLIDPTSSISYYTNGGRAKSQGVELSAQAAPVKGLRLGGWISSSNAVLSQDLPPDSASVGMRGDPLPFNSRFSGNASVDYEVPLSRYTVRLGWVMTYVGASRGDFTDTTDRQVRPAYTTQDLRLGTEVNEWHLDLYCNNVTDRRGVTGGGIGTLHPDYFEYIRPRTLSLSVGRSF